MANEKSREYRVINEGGTVIREDTLRRWAQQGAANIKRKMDERQQEGRVKRASVVRKQREKGLANRKARRDAEREAWMDEQEELSKTNGFE
tara:strand:- start:793 stop:1065 length:273 start_codon:yes stop_codon:yes gene_type:complete